MKWRERDARLGVVAHARFKMPTDVAILAFAAGLFEGEGSISIVCVSKQNSDKRYHRLMVSLTSTEPVFIEWLQKHFGGFVGQQRSFAQAHGRWKPAQRWQSNSSHAEDFLRAIRPYLIGKSRQADVAFDFRATRREHLGSPRGAKGGSANPVTDEMFVYRESLRQEMLALNARGVAS